MVVEAVVLVVVDLVVQIDVIVVVVVLILELHCTLRAVWMKEQFWLTMAPACRLHVSYIDDDIA